MMMVMSMLMMMLLLSLDYDYCEGGESGNVDDADESSKKRNDNVDSRTQYAHRLDFALGKQHKLAPEAQGSS